MKNPNLGSYRLNNKKVTLTKHEGRFYMCHDQAAWADFRENKDSQGNKFLPTAFGLHHVTLLKGVHDNELTALKHWASSMLGEYQLTKEGSTIFEQAPEPEAKPQPQPQPQPQPMQQAPVQAPTGDQVTAALLPLFGGVQSAIKAEIMNELKPILNQAPIKHELVITLPDGAKTKLEGKLNPNFESIVWDLANGIAPYLYGPAGTGKSTIGEQAAKALNLDFYPVPSIHTDEDIFGTQDVNGNYIPSPFYNAFKNGGLVMFDEFEGAYPEVLIKLNQALANKVTSFPIVGLTKAHPNFRYMATANTIGQGATDNYHGVSAQNKATLNRFGTFYYIDYDKAIEEQIGGKVIASFIRDLRKVCKDKSVDLVCGYRELKSLRVKESSPISTQEQIKQVLLNRVGKDEQIMLIGAIKRNGNKYNEALADITL